MEIKRVTSSSSSSWLMIQAIALVYLLPGSQASDTNYCDPKLCDSGDKHIACNNNGSFASSCPPAAKLLDLDTEAQQALVDAHNQVRQRWASGQGEVGVNACRMATISWNSELARLAELNVKQCEMTHEACHNTNQFESSGQNLYSTSRTGMPTPDVKDLLRAAVDEWASESQHIKADYLALYPTDYDGPAIGHFTMVANEHNVAVGCAISNYLTGSSDTYLVACNYATNNYIGEPVYTSCSKSTEHCKNGTNPEHSALCV